MKTKVLEEFVDVQIALKDEDAEALGPRMALHECFEGLEVDIADVVHPPIYLAQIDAEKGQLVAIEGILQEAYVYFDFELGLE